VAQEYIKTRLIRRKFVVVRVSHLDKDKKVCKKSIANHLPRNSTQYIDNLDFLGVVLISNCLLCHASLSYGLHIMLITLSLKISLCTGPDKRKIGSSYK